MDTTIKDATNDDLKAIAACHIAAFPNSFTSKLGINFVSNMMRWYLSGKNKVIFWINEDGKCIGYCGGYVMDGSDAYGATSGMTQFGFNSAVIALMLRPWLLFHPELLSKYKFIWTNILRKLKLKKSTKTGIIAPPHQLNPEKKLQAGLVVIGVMPSLHKKGIGSLLIKEFENRTYAMGARFFSLSVRQENAKAIQSYERNGWKITVEEGKVSYIMTKTID